MPTTTHSIPGTITRADADDLAAISTTQATFGDDDTTYVDISRLAALGIDKPVADHLPALGVPDELNGDIVVEGVGENADDATDYDRRDLRSRFNFFDRLRTYYQRGPASEECRNELAYRKYETLPALAQLARRVLNGDDVVVVCSCDVGQYHREVCIEAVTNICHIACRQPVDDVAAESTVAMAVQQWADRSTETTTPTQQTLDALATDD